MNIIFICIKIFFARILDVTICTFRQNILLKGKMLLAAILAFFEIMIWFFVAREALLISIDSVLIPVSYSLGYATGTLIGAYLSKKLIKGQIAIQIIIDKNKDDILKALKIRGYEFSLLKMENYSKEQKNNKVMIFLEVNLKSIKKVEQLINQYDNKAFVIISDTKKVYNGKLK